MKGKDDKKAPKEKVCKDCGMPMSKCKCKGKKGCKC